MTWTCVFQYEILPCLGHIPLCSDQIWHLYLAWPVSKPLHRPTILLQSLKHSSLTQKPKEGSAAALCFLHSHQTPINKTEQTFTSEEISIGHESLKIKSHLWGKRFPTDVGHSLLTLICHRCEVMDVSEWLRRQIRFSPTPIRGVCLLMLTDWPHSASGLFPGGCTL